MKWIGGMMRARLSRFLEALAVTMKIVVAAVACLVLAASANAAGRAPRDGRVTRTIERTTAFRFVGSPTGNELGDYVVLATQELDTKGQQIGTGNDVCFRTVPDHLRSCTLIYDFGGSLLTLQGLYRDDGTGLFAITGGTGRYRSATGWMEILDTTTPDGQVFSYDEIFHLNGSESR
jgi:allene oxide cyclase